jgi:hypothetical protein
MESEGNGDNNEKQKAHHLRFCFSTTSSLRGARSCEAMSSGRGNLEEESFAAF